MPETNLFTMLSAYRPGSPATPFEVYCISGLAYFLQRGQRMLIARIADAAGAGHEPLAMVEVQPRLADAGFADLVLTFEGGARALIEVQVEAGADERHLPGIEAAATGWAGPVSRLFLALPGAPPPDGWRAISWLDVIDALSDDPDPLAQQFVEFVQRDILGAGPVPLDEAIATNRLYALGAAAVRRRYGTVARYVNSASRPVGGRYRYLGTTFSPEGENMEYWVGIVNETVPLNEHYYLMLASKTRPLDQPAEQPRATGDWKWEHWTGLGRVVRPVTVDDYDALLARIR